MSDHFDAVHVGAASRCFLPPAAQRAAELQRGEIEAGPVGSASLRPPNALP